MFAWLKGRPAERYGSLVYLAAFLLDIPLALITGKILPVESVLFVDGLAALGFLFLALRYNSLWLGAAMMLKGAELGLHAFHLTEEADPQLGAFNLYVLALDALEMMMVLSLFAGTLASIRARRRAAAQPAPPNLLEPAPRQAA